MPYSVLDTNALSKCGIKHFYNERRVHTVYGVGSKSQTERSFPKSVQPWAELTRRLGTHPHTVRRWRNAAVRPGNRHMMASLAVAGEQSLPHLLAVRRGVTKTLYPVHWPNAPDDAADWFKFRITEPCFVILGARQLDHDASITLLDEDSETLNHKPASDTAHHMFYATPLEDTCCLKVDAAEGGANEYLLAHGARDATADWVAMPREKQKPRPVAHPDDPDSVPAGEVALCDISDQEKPPERHTAGNLAGFICKSNRNSRPRHGRHHICKGA